MSEVRKLILEATERLAEAAALIRKAAELIPKESVIPEVPSGSGSVTPQADVRFGYAPTTTKTKFHPADLAELEGDLTSNLDCRLEGSNYVINLKSYIGPANYRKLFVFVEKYGGHKEGQGKETKFVIPGN